VINDLIKIRSHGISSAKRIKNIENPLLKSLQETQHIFLGSQKLETKQNTIPQSKMVEILSQIPYKLLIMLLTFINLFFVLTLF